MTRIFHNRAATRAVKAGLVAMVWLCVWAAAARLVGSSLIVASPGETFARLFALARTALFWDSISTSFVRIFTGFILSAVCGVVLAAASCRFALVDDIFRPAINVINAIPVASFTIIALLAFSSAQLPVFVAFVTVLPIFFHNTKKGIQAADANLLQMARLFDVPAHRQLRYIYLGAVAPFVISAASVGIGFAFKSGIAAEVIGLVSGTIGAGLHTARIFLMSADVFAWTIAIVLLSFLMEKIITAVLGRLQWQ